MSYFENISCPLCQELSYSEKFKFEYATNYVLDVIQAPVPYPIPSIVKCNNCNHHYVIPQITSEKLNEYYSNETSTYYTFVGKESNHLKSKHTEIYKRIQNYVDHGRIMEIGCGLGYLLSYFPKEKWDRIGIEPSKDISSFGRDNLGLKILTEFLDYSTFKKDSFDVIMLFDVMEHLKDASGMIDLVKYYLKPGGLLVFGTGNIESIEAKLYGKLWGYLSTWDHISFFSIPGIKYLLDNKNLKTLEILETSYKGKISYFVVGLFKNICIKFPYNMMVRISNIFNIDLGIKQRKYHGLFDHLIVFARK